MDNINNKDNLSEQTGQFKRCMLHFIKKNINKREKETEMSILKKIRNLMTVLVLVLALGASACGGQKSVARSKSTTTTVSKYGQNSYSTRTSSGVKTNVSPYGRSSYISRTYSPNGSLQKTQVVVPYGLNGWLIR